MPLSSYSSQVVFEAFHNRVSLDIVVRIVLNDLSQDMLEINVLTDKKTLLDRSYKQVLRSQLQASSAICTRDLGAIKNEIVHFIYEFLSQRFDVDQRLVGILRQFVSIQAGCDMKKVHNAICTDLDLMDLTLESEDVLRSGDADDIRKLKLPQLVQPLCKSRSIYPNMIIALSNPHSCA